MRTGQPAGAHLPVTPSLPAVSVAEWQQNLALPTLASQSSCIQPLEPLSTSVAYQGYPAPGGTFQSLMHLNPSERAPSYQQPLYFNPSTDTMHLFHPMSPYQSYEPAMSTLPATFPSTNQFSSDAFNVQASELSAVPSTFDYTPAAHSLLPSSNYYQPAPPFISLNPTNAATNSSDTQISSSPSKCKRARHPTYVPRISRTKDSLRHGVLCAIVFECKWKDCKTIFRLEGSSMADETIFQKRVHGHLDEHARSASTTHGQLECQWGDSKCTVTLSPRDCKRKTMMRHLLKETAAWYFFCPKVDCHETLSRKLLITNHKCAARSG
ncbi:hypothetical protein C0991_003098 [Blastosporella zonata]|nr:hypothetical protein C0991_003098 [Blastosporella zonata]